MGNIRMESRTAHTSPSQSKASVKRRLNFNEHSPTDIDIELQSTEADTKLPRRISFCSITKNKESAYINKESRKKQVFEKAVMNTIKSAKKSIYSSNIAELYKKASANI